MKNVCLITYLPLNPNCLLFVSKLSLRLRKTPAGVIVSIKKFEFMLAYMASRNTKVTFV